VRSRLQSFHFLPLGDDAEWDAELVATKNEVIQYSLQASFAKTPPDLAVLERVDVARVFDAAIAYVRDVLVIRAGAADLAVEEAMLDKKNFAGMFSMQSLEDKIEAFALAKERTLQNINLKLVSAALWDDMGKSHGR
jgi:hypothetical protein